MSGNEYIEFSFSSSAELKAFKQLFDKIKDFHNGQKEYEFDLLDQIIPDYVRMYFRNNKTIGWSLSNLIDFLIKDLDVIYIDVLENSETHARLGYEANGYPYGGPNALILL